MPRFTVRCLKCGNEAERFLKGGDHPPCQDCLGQTDYVWRATGASHGIVTDEAFIGGLVVENLGHEPVTVYSRQELAQRMHQARVEQRIKYVPGDKYLSNWALAIDPQTLANAKALVERNGLAQGSAPEPAVRVTTSVRKWPYESPAAE